MKANNEVHIQLDDVCDEQNMNNHQQITVC